MTREIKFRYIFRLEDGKLLKVDLTLDEIESGQVGNIYQGQDEAEHNPVKGIFARLQFTGSKDKNGVEIYENDKVQDRKEIAVVKYEDGYFYPLAKSPKSGFVEAGDPWRYPESCEVIGKIYEDEDLLTNKK